DRAQVLIEKLTELGATAFVPLRTGRSVVEPRETRLEKLERYVIEASKQCGRNVLMSIEPPADWDDFVHAQRRGGKLLAHPGGGLDDGRSGAAHPARRDGGRGPGQLAGADRGRTSGVTP